MATLFVPIRDSATLYQTAPTINTGGDQQLALLGSGSQILLRTDPDVYDEAMSLTSGSVEQTLWMVTSNRYQMPGPISLSISAINADWTTGVGLYSDTATRGGVNWATKPALKSTPAPVSTSLPTGFDDDVLLPLTGFEGQSHGISIARSDNALTEQEIYFYGVPTHTIYPPKIQVSWNDAIYAPTSQMANAIAPNDYRISITGVPARLLPDNKYRVSLSVQSKYLTRQWNKSPDVRLPADAYWRLRDVKTGFYIPTTPSSTTISLVNGEHFFSFYTHGLPLNRYYQFDIVISGVVHNQLIPFYLHGPS